MTPPAHILKAVQDITDWLVAERKQNRINEPNAKWGDPNELDDYARNLCYDLLSAAEVRPPNDINPLLGTERCPLCMM